MRVLYVSKASYVVAHRDKLAPLAREVSLHVVVPERWGRASPEPDDPVHPPLERLAALGHGHNHLHWYPALGRVLDRVRPTLVHLDEEPWSLVTAHAAELCRRRGIPFVFFGCQNLVKRLPPPFELLRRRVYGTAAGGLGGTEAAGAVLRRTGFGGPVAVVPQMGVDPDRFRPDAGARCRLRQEAGIDADAVVAGFVGRLVRQKGVDLFVDAVAATPGVRGVVIGDGPRRRSLEARARDGGADDRVTFVGAVPSTEVPGWMAALDLLVLPSRTMPGLAEQFGRVLIEALACGVPVVVSDSGEMAGVAGDGAVVVREGRVEPLARALAGLASDPARRRALADAGRARVLERFTQARIARETVAFWRTLDREAER